MNPVFSRSTEHNTKPRFINVIRQWALCVLLILATTLLTIRTVIYIRDTQSSADQMRESYYEQQRNLIKSEVNRFSKTLEYELDKMLGEAKTQVQVRVSTAHSIAQNIYSQHNTSKSNAEIQQFIIESLRPIRLDQTGGYYFISGFDGVPKLFADRPDQEGISMMERQDSQGQFVLKDMIKMLKSKGEGFYTYHWTKPGEEGNDYKKIAYLKTFQPLDCFIGTGIYLDDLEADLQKKIFHYVSTHRFGPNSQGYVFINELLDIKGGKQFAKVYANPNRPDDTGKIISDDYKDAKGKQFRKEFLKGLRENGECFVDYWYKKIGQTSASPKTSYFKLAGNGRFMVAAGVYLDDVEKEIAMMQDNLKKRLWNGLFILSSIFISVILLVLVFSNWLSNRLENDFQVFADFFKRAADSSISIDRNKIKFSELDILAESANSMLFQKAKTDNELLDTRDRLTEAQRMAKVGHFVFDLKNNKWTNSSELNNIFGIDDDFNRTISGWLQIVHPDYREKMSGYLYGSGISHHKKFDMEYKIIHQKTQESRWVHGLGNIKFDKDNKLNGMFGTIQDISKIKTAYNALKESEERFRLAFLTIPDAICLNRLSDGLYIDINEGFTNLTGYTRQELSGRTSLEIHIWKNSEDRMRLLNDLRDDGFVSNFEARFVRKNGEIGIGLMSARILYINDEAVIQSIIRDITEIRKAEKDRIRLEKQLQQTQKMEAIGTLAGGIAHDFNNILSGIIGYSQLALIESKTNEELSKHINQIMHGAQRASDLTKQILTFSNQGEYEKQPFKIYLEVKEALKLLRSTIPTTIDIKTKITSEQKVLADPIKIHQVVMNLCTNAYHAMRKTGGTLTVELTDFDISDSNFNKNREMATGRYVKLEVADTGHGMEQEIVEKIFEPYFSTKEKGDGTGLGLAIVRAIVEEHDGYLEVDSQPGKGTKFSLFFPIVTENLEQPPSEIETEINVSGTERIMLVDDEKHIRNSYKNYLEVNGYHVQTFENGTDALSAFKKKAHLFDLIITDMTMPGLTGDKFAREILKIEPDFPIILWTGFNENISRNRSIELGIKEFVQKPVSNYELSALIRKIFDTS